MKFSNPDPRFTGPAYDYVRENDEMPNWQEVADDENPLVRIKLFHPVGRYTYYAWAATEYQEYGIILSGYCLSPFGPECDEMGDQSVVELAQPSAMGLPVERDIHFEPLPLKDLLAKLEMGAHV
jgi:hypothetical protein